MLFDGPQHTDGQTERALVLPEFLNQFRNVSGAEPLRLRGRSSAATGKNAEMGGGRYSQV